MATAKRKPGRPRTALGTPGTGVNVKLGTKLFEAVRYASDETGLTQAAIVRAALSEWVTKHKRRSTPKAGLNETQQQPREG